MSLAWGREICGDLPLAESREWLGDPAAARTFLQPLAHYLDDYGVGSIAEIFEGDPPFRPRGCIAQAWSVSETLRAWLETAGERTRTRAAPPRTTKARGVRRRSGS